MKTSDAGINLIKEFEGFRSAPYHDAVGKPTIGYGWTHGVSMNDKPITEAEATKKLVEGLTSYETGVLNCVEVDLQQCEFDALICLAYNLGIHALQTSTLLKLLNKGDYMGAAEQFQKWNKAGGKVLDGLSRRRKAECEMFLNGAHYG